MIETTSHDHAGATPRAQIISEALPYIRRLHGQTVVIKYGGAAMTEDHLKAAVMGDIALLHYVGVKIVVVHGGGPEISAMCRQMGIEPQFVAGMRVTDEATMRVTEMVMGQIGKGIAQLLHEKGAPAVGLSGKDGGLLRARKFEGEADWGLVGEIDEVRPRLLHTLAREGFVPVVTPVAPGEQGETYNINADLAAAAIASALGAVKLLLLTDVAGIYRDFNDKSSLIEALDADAAQALIADGIVAKGMIPKVRCCVDAVRAGVARAHIIDGRERHAILTELFTDHGCGTMIARDVSR
ncbi:MAG TPA: acetylglutamate kinase [Abditibacteriaceae bacterium]|nr:acetylglutamate kinase [Abditibacteriaceae bacterium]